jgi:hypothetical protein
MKATKEIVVTTDWYDLAESTLDSKIDWLKRQQLDAFKAGERFAAELIGDVSILQDYGFVQPFKDTGHEHFSVKQAILTDANNRTELP